MGTFLPIFFRLIFKGISIFLKKKENYKCILTTSVYWKCPKVFVKLSFYGINLSSFMSYTSFSLQIAWPLWKIAVGHTCEEVNYYLISYLFLYFTQLGFFSVTQWRCVRFAENEIKKNKQTKRTTCHTIQSHFGLLLCSNGWHQPFNIKCHALCIHKYLKHAFCPARRSEAPWAK